MGISFLDRALATTVGRANLALNGILGAYGRFADHRHETISQTDLNTSAYCRANTRTIHLIRGMTHFAPSTAFIETLTSLGHIPKLFSYASEHEANRFRQWRENTVDVLSHLIQHPEYLGSEPTFLGHSAGGFVVYILAALADGADPEKILEVLRPTAPLASVLSVHNLKILGEQLTHSHAQFVTLGTPIHGIKLTRMGRAFNWVLKQTNIPNFLSSITHETIQEVYRTIGKDPEKVIYRFYVSETPPKTNSKDPLSWLVQEMLRYGYRVCSPFLDHEEDNDGLVPVSTAQPRSEIGMTKLRWIRFDHLKMFDLAQAGLEIGADLFSSTEQSATIH